MGYEDRFTEGVKNVLNIAYTTAAELGHSYVGSSIYWSVWRDRRNGHKTLKNYGMSADKILVLVESNVGKGTPAAAKPGPHAKLSALSSAVSPKPHGLDTTWVRAS